MMMMLLLKWSTLVWGWMCLDAWESSSSGGLPLYLPDWIPKQCCLYSLLAGLLHRGLRCCFGLRSRAPVRQSCAQFVQCTGQMMILPLGAASSPVIIISVLFSLLSLFWPEVRSSNCSLSLSLAQCDQKKGRDIVGCCLGLMNTTAASTDGQGN